ncbi:MAG: CoA-binding protein [Desulfurococcales archaeon]|nr:CoA-binding protein [Desulfurococcales archaeon]
MGDLPPLFNPKSVAVIGASDEPTKLGYDVFKNLRKYPHGKVYPINVRREYVQGVKAYRSVKDVPETPDLAVIVVPKRFVKQSLKECGEAGVKAAIIITAGFREAGEAGLKEELELVRIAREYGMRFVGPNCVGVMNVPAGLNATFVMDAKPGYVAFVSQSGALGGAIIYKTVKESIGFSKFVSVGNMADIDFSDLMLYLRDDRDTKAIALYVEGVRDGKRFIEVAEEVVRRKPVIVLKGGRFGKAARAVASHTGSLAGNYRIYEAAFKQSGILEASTIDEMLSMARAFTVPLPRTSGGVVRAAILTNAGGAGVLVSDELERRGVPVADLEPSTIDKLRKVLPPMAAVKNPVDMIASATGEDYYRVTKLLLSDPNVDLVIAACVVPTFAGMTPTEHAEGVVKAWNESGRAKPLLALFMAGEVSAKAREYLEREGVPTYERPEDVASAAEALARQALNEGAWR